MASAHRTRRLCHPSRIAALLKDARRYFHVILVDSGPILGSLEAAVLASQVDGSILTISRGQDRTLVRNAMQRLRSLRTSTTGFVYNRAKSQDFQSSPYASSSYSFTSVASGEEELGKGRSAKGDLAVRPTSPWTSFGPLVRAVGTNVPIPSAN